MPSLDCQHCAGTGYMEDAGRNAIICPWCDGTDVVFVDETAGDALGDAGT